jgi:acyl carrier protein
MAIQVASQNLLTSVPHRSTFIQNPSPIKTNSPKVFKMALSQDEIFEKVQEALVEALGVDDDEVTEEATLVGDLGAESIDFLDIVFKLEKAFGIQIPREELSPEDILTDSNLVKDGIVTSEGIAELKSRMPWANLDAFEQNPRVQDFGNLLTVGDLVGYVGSKTA